MDLRFHTLGTPRLFRDGTEVFRIFRSPARCGLLFVVAVEGETTRPALMGMFWPDSDEERARHALSQTLYTLRKDFEGEVLELDGEKVRVAGSPWIDAHEFRSRAKAGEAEGARSLYRGPFMYGSYLANTRGYEDWVDTWRSRVAQSARQVFRSLVDSAAASGRHDDAVQAARAWVGEDSLDDSAQSALIAALARSGRRAEALRQFEAYSAMLREELDIAPLATIEDLVRDIRRGSLDAVAGHVFDGQGRAGLQIVRSLGQGRAAEVFLARESALERLVAVKVLRAELQADSVALARFEREAVSAGRLHHPNIAPVYRTGRMDSGAPFIAIPYVEGGSLADRRSRDPAWRPDVRRVVRQVAAGLAAAHASGVIHRDIRPGNVLMDDHAGRLMICDFGVAGLLDPGPDAPALTRTGELLGHPAYMAPEQIRGEPVTDRTDVYALGVTAFELLTGAPPFEGGPVDVLEQHVDAEAPPVPADDDALREIVTACLAKEARLRPSADEIRHALAF